MDTQWFLGGNTAQGFVSRFGDLHEDPRVKELVILKGGPGCGKSTFMKRLRDTANRLGADTESYPCSSDPDSLDGLLVMPIGFAVVDGTSPHVVEPQLCACDGIYLNLGCFYDAAGVKSQEATLRVLKKENQALYPAAYAHLSAARALRECAAQTLEKQDAKGLYRLTRMLVQEPNSKCTGRGRLREVFLHTFTPKGEIRLSDTLTSYGSVIGIHDPYGVSAPMLARIREKYLDAGYDVICALDPLEPTNPEAMLIPEAGMAFVSGEKYPSCAISAELSHFMRPTEESEKLLEASRAHRAQAVELLQRAKAIHDELEACYRSYVSFEGLDLLTQEYQKKLKAMLLQK